MTSEIVCVGTELLLGQIVNTNAAYVARVLAEHGINMYRQTSVGDNRDRLLQALQYGFSQADMVVTIGGLGPTQDDISKAVAAELFGCELQTHAELLAKITARFEAGKLPENAWRNSINPVGARLLDNNIGLAAGVIMEGDGKTLVMLPGPPHELMPMVENQLVPWLCEICQDVFVSKNLLISGIGETQTESILMDLIQSQTNPTIAPYAKLGEVQVRFTAKASSRAEAEELLQPVLDEARKLLGRHIYGEDDQTLPGAVADLLRQGKHTLALAESCTGGLVAATLTEVPGVSDVFVESCVTYCNRSKVLRLGVPTAILDAHGAVSAETAAAMAAGAAHCANTTVGLSITGIAGPDGGSDEKPVGLVYIGLFIAPGFSQTHRYVFPGGRNEIRRRAMAMAFTVLRRALV